MSFKNPYFFLLLIPLLIAAVYVSKNYHRVFFKTNFPIELKKNYTIRVFLADALPYYLKLIIMVLIIIALARPQKILKGEIPPTEGIDIMMVIDTSLSMAAVDVIPSRLEAAKTNAKEFVSKRMGDRIGIVIFGGVAYLSCPLTMDHSAVTAFIDRIQLGMTKADGTAIGDAILVATNHLKKSKAKSRIMVLLTDGRSNAGVVQDPVTAAKLSSEFGIKIYTIGIGGKGPSKVPTGDPSMPYTVMEDDLNEAQLMEIAKMTQAQYFRATTSKEMSEIYSEIDRLEKTKFEVKYNVQITELYNKFLIPAIILLALLIILQKTFILTVP
jgi:Ca-activated chloride channel family protein